MDIPRLNDLFEGQHLEWFHDITGANPLSFLDLWIAIDADEGGIFTKVPKHTDLGYVRLQKQFQGIPDYLPHNDRAFMHTFCIVKNTSMELIHFYNGARYSNFIRPKRQSSKKIVTVVRFSSGHYNLLTSKGGRFNGLPTTRLGILLYFL